jgi:hypothetical protein
MDRETLVNTLKDLFQDRGRTGITIDAIGLAPAYSGMVKNSYVLGISAPGMEGRDCYEKADAIISLLFREVSPDIRKMVDRVRVYDSQDELRSHASNDFDSDECDVCARPMNLNAQTYEMERA